MLKVATVTDRQTANASAGAVKKKKASKVGKVRIMKSSGPSGVAFKESDDSCRG